ncbi:MAG: universal stress protein [Flavobacteriaceae bacterium]|nr:universal stress protein [Flavobacteriaceae bacterium]
MKRKILLPTDFSKNAWHAISYALELYKNDDCTFYILNAFTSKGYLIESLMVPEPGESKYEAAKLKSEKGLAKILDMLIFSDDGNPKHNFTTISIFNSPVEAIKNVVEEKDIEIVIMGTMGETNSKSVMYGSNAINVMEKVRHCPILVVPIKAELTLPKEIVFPTNYKTHFKRRELNYLTDIAKNCNASIRILHISEEDELDKNQINNKKLLEEYFEGIDYSFHLLSYITIPTAINCFVESRESDMVAFINRKHAFFGSILTQPLVKDIGYHSKIPVLVMHDLRN